MNRLLIGVCAALAIGGLMMAWSSKTAALRERDRAVAAKADAHANAALAHSAAIAASRAAEEEIAIEQPGNRVALQGDDGVVAQLQGIAARLDGLEAAVRQLQQQAAGKPPVDTLNTAESIEQALRGLAGMPGERERRIALLERFLDLFPNAPNAQAMLEALIGENLSSEPELGLASLDRYGSRVVADPLKLEEIRANVLIQNRRFDEGRACYERVLRSATNDRDMADSSFWIAYSYMQEPRYDLAQAKFEALIARFELDPSPEVASIVKGAKNQLELIAKYKNQK